MTAKAKQRTYSQSLRHQQYRHGKRWGGEGGGGEGRRVEEGTEVTKPNRTGQINKYGLQTVTAVQS